MEQFIKWLKTEELQKMRPTVDEINFKSLFIGSLVSVVANFMACILRKDPLQSLESIVFGLMAAFYFFVFIMALCMRKKEKLHHYSLFMLYSSISFSLIVYYISGVFFKNDILSIAFFLVIAISPLFILDTRRRSILYSTILTAIYMISAGIYNDRLKWEFIRLSLLAYILNIAITIINLDMRITSLSNYRKLLETNMYDELTGLYNWNYFVIKAKEIIEAKKLQNKCSIIFYDFKGMRNFNRDFGYENGDWLLKTFAEILKSVYTDRIIGRFGEDHFILLVYNEEWERYSRTVIEKLNVLLNEKIGREMPVEFSNDIRTDNYLGALNLTMKIGIAEVRDGVDVNDACERARLACHAVDSGLLNGYRKFDEELREKSRNEAYVLNHLDEAIENNYIRPYYMPIVRSMTNEVCGEEALARWIDPVYGIIQPSKFVPVLENRLLLYKLDIKILKSVLEDFSIRRSKGLQIVPVSINLSRNDFYGRDMVKIVSDMVSSYGYNPSLINIEITESAYSSNPDIFIREVDRFHQAGFKVWMDDFGSGYSSLNLLQDSHFDLIKLDMRFMQNFGSKNKLIISAILSMASRLGVDTLQEGVETVEQQKFLRRTGLERQQGFLYGRPVSLDEILKREEKGSGIHFEKTYNTAYYEKVGSIDITDPFSFQRDNLVRGFVDSVPCFIGEWDPKEEKLYVMRANESFEKSKIIKEIKSLDLNSSIPEKRFLKIDKEIIDILNESIRLNKWTKTMTTMGGTSINVYAHEVAINGHNENHAILLVAIFT